MSQADSGMLKNIMICPKCKKKNNKKEISKDFIIEINSFKRVRRCECGEEFTTFEIISELPIGNLDFKFSSISKRKESKRTAWQDWRFLCYAREHYFNVVLEVNKILKKINLEKKLKDGILEKKFKDGILEVKKVESNKRGKIIYYFKDKENNKEYVSLASNIKIRSVRRLLKRPEYWENRKLYSNNKNLSEIKREDEERQFLKSLNHKKTGIRSSKYNLEFLKRDSFLKDKYISPNEKEFWFLWKNIR